jgi:hypothetical protein
MSEKLILGSYIVRVYRTDSDDPKRVVGLVEALDGAGAREPFDGIEELAAALNGMANRDAEIREGYNKMGGIPVSGMSRRAPAKKQ